MIVLGISRMAILEVETLGPLLAGIHLMRLEPGKWNGIFVTVKTTASTIQKGHEIKFPSKPNIGGRNEI